MPIASETPDTVMVPVFQTVPWSANATPTAVVAPETSNAPALTKSAAKSLLGRTMYCCEPAAGPLVDVTMKVPSFCTRAAQLLDR